MSAEKGPYRDHECTTSDLSLIDLLGDRRFGPNHQGGQTVDAGFAQTDQFLEFGFLIAFQEFLIGIDIGLDEDDVGNAGVGGAGR